MVASLVLATLAATFAPTAAISEHMSEPARIDVAYEQLRTGDTDAAVRQLEDCPEIDRDDPARLINHGSAYAREGRYAEAEAMFRAAIASDERYRLELADGSWVDSRQAARLALAGLERGTVALR